MSRLTDLVAQAKRENPQLGLELEKELRSSKQRTFGLVFERHLPETVALPGRPVRKGDTVQILPPRSSTEEADPTLWRVIKIDRSAEEPVAELTEANPTTNAEPEKHSGIPVDDLLVVAEQENTIYPGLVQTGEVISSDDPNAAFHTVINAENYHALKMLTYTHRHSVDCIYIDPPYNTGARDWKYNNDYVDGDDDYRHSKWLSFMERRLLIAKELLNPDDSVLIVTIDEKEYLRLGLLLEQTFPSADIQMVSAVIHAGGQTRTGRISRVDEYIYYVFIGDGHVTATIPSSDSGKIGGKIPRVWFPAIRGATGNALRSASPRLFYPVYVKKDSGEFHSAGSPIGLEQDTDDVPVFEGTIAIWPRLKGFDGTWRFSPQKMREYFALGYAKIIGKTPESWAINYLRPGTIKLIEDGTYSIKSHGKYGDVELTWGPNSRGKPTPPKTVWNYPSHAARMSGTELLKKFLPNRVFPFPKSLYAVEDTLRFAVEDKPNATVLDFFSGSGTTAHAVMRLNKQDGGNRRSISVTNNEVGVDEQKKLIKQGLRPGDLEWEQWGICDYVTKPRIKAAITGQTPDGNPIKGDYKFTDEFPMSDGFKANAKFFTLTYEPKTRVRYGLAFDRIAPLLWMRAGQTGRMIESMPASGWDVAEAYGVIKNVADIDSFIEAVEQTGTVTTAFIITDDDLVFSSTARKLEDLDLDLVRLYSTYLNNFAFQNAQETY